MLPSHGRSRGFESLVAHHPSPAVLRRPPPELLLLRHGQTEWNRDGRFQGALDSPLTPEGRAQARAMGRALADLGVGPATHRARTSPQGRAAVTALLALAPLGLGATEDPRLAEIGMGDWTGLTRAEIAARWPGPEGEGFLAFYARCAGGEPLEAVAARARAALAALDGPAVVVTHGVTLRLLCAAAMGHGLAEAEGYALRQGCVVRLAGGRMEVLEPGLPGAGAAASPDAAGG